MGGAGSCIFLAQGSGFSGWEEAVEVGKGKLSLVTKLEPWVGAMSSWCPATQAGHRQGDDEEELLP